MTARDPLASVPRRPLVPGPTPLEPASDLGRALGVRRGLWAKRDDLTGPGLSGNKVRKLEFLLADASTSGCDALVTVGAAQSNHARLTAITGIAAGFDVHLVLGGGRPEAIEGNLLLGQLSGANIHYEDSEDWAVLERRLGEIADGLTAAGRRPYVIPMGGSTPVGVRGYVAGFLELRGQLRAAGVTGATLVLASSTGGTQAGLLAGLTMSGGDAIAGIVGVDVAKASTDLERDVVALADGTLETLGVSVRVDERDAVVAPAPGGAYGEVTEEGSRGFRVGLRTCGLVTDPVYSAKALGALPRLEREGIVTSDGPLVFLHTGGQPALFTRRYADEILPQRIEQGVPQ